MPTPSGVVVSDNQKAATSRTQLLKISTGSPKPHITLMGDMNSRKD